MAEKLAHDLEWIADRSVPLYLRTLVVTGFRVLAPDARRAARSTRPAMCGICGIASARGAVDRERLAAMSATLVHRGPDSEGTLRRRRRRARARGGSRSSTSTGGDQPIANEDGTCIGRPERRDLQLPRAARASSSAPATASARTATPRCSSTPTRSGALGFAERLRGMFAVAIWDARAAAARARARPVRDQAALLPRRRRRARRSPPSSTRCRSGELDLDALEAFLAFNSIPAPLSIFREIRKLPPGHTLLTWEDGRVALERFARPGPLAAAPRRRRGGARRGVPRAAARLGARAPRRRRARRRAALRRRRLRRARGARRARSRRSRCGRSRSGSRRQSFDELAGARAVAERYGTQHRELVLRPDAALLLPALADAFDEPFADSSALPTYLVSKLAAEDVKVALSGEGGDELFGGYYTYVADLLAERVGPPRGARAAARRAAADARPRSASFDYKAKRFVRAAHLPPLERHHGWKEIFSRRRARRADRARGTACDPLAAYRARLRRDGGPRAARRGCRTSTSASTSSTTCS